MNTGNVYADLKDYQKTEELFNKAYTVIEKEDHPANLALITYNLGALYYRQKRFPEAEAYITKSLNANLKIGDQLKIERCYRVLGAINTDQGNHFKAEDFYFKALNIAEEINNPKSILGNYKNLFINYGLLEEKTGQTGYLRKQLDYYRKWAALNDSLYQIETAEKILELEKQYETEKKNTQIALLEKENQLKEDEIYIQHAQRNYLVVIIILVSGILSIFIYFFYYYKKVNRLLQVQGKSILQQKDHIAEQNKQLQKSVNTQNKLFSIIAHDLRSPLVSISNFSKLIAFYIEGKQFASLEEIARLMDKKNDAVLDLTDNLLSWAKSQTENLVPYFEPVNLKETVEECLEVYQSIAEEKTIMVRCDDLKEKLLWADRNMLRTICRNLINNAIKFTPQGGTIQICYQVDLPFVTVCVEDSGIGIGPDKMEILFEFDHEKVAAGTDGEKSSGLGLTVCREFVQAMKGEIWANSQPGKGSEFCFKLLLFDPDVHQVKYKKVQKTIQAPSAN
jgi:signal transduction histidine kinase